MNMAFCYSMLPVIKKLYPTKEEQTEAMQRHLEFFNTTPHLSTLILGITAAMEEQNANDPEFETESINNVKVSLMGPLAGIGDSFIWGTLRIIATGVGVSLAAQGNILGPLLFLLLFNIPAQGLRFYLMHAGYKLGSGFLAKVQESGLMDDPDLRRLRVGPHGHWRHDGRERGHYRVPRHRLRRRRPPRWATFATRSCPACFRSPSRCSCTGS